MNNADKSLRICIDFRLLHSKTKLHRTKPLEVQEILQTFHGVKYFARIDLTQGFYKLPFSEASKPFTIFPFENHLYEFETMPFGLSNGTQAFTAAMNTVLGDSVHDFCMCHVDDILIFSTHFSEHLQHIAQ